MNPKSIRTWLRPGMFVKRWLALLLFSVTLTGLAFAMFLVWAYRTIDFPTVTTDFIRVATLQFIPIGIRALIVLTIAGCLLVFSVWKISHSLVVPLLARSSTGQRFAEIVAEHRFGPVKPQLRVVAVGGGTGLSNLLRGLKKENLAITAIVTVADDGGSTGRIREEFNIPAPGDIRNCIVALAEEESTVGKLFQYRFDREGSDLSGHSFGNLFITALSQVTGSFEHAVIESGKVLNIRGRVLPSTLENVTLCAELEDDSILCGESSISHKTSPIRRIFLSPGEPDAYEPALGAILNADLIILGPGSLYTSVLPNLMVAGITHAIRYSAGTKVYVCNVATQPGETDHLNAEQHIQAIVDHVGPGLIGFAMVNNNQASAEAIGPDVPIETVDARGLSSSLEGIEIIQGDVVNDRNPLRHDPDKLTQAILQLAKANRSGLRRVGDSTNRVPITGHAAD